MAAQLYSSVQLEKGASATKVNNQAKFFSCFLLKYNMQESVHIVSVVHIDSFFQLYLIFKKLFNLQ